MGLNSIVDFLAKKGVVVDANPNAKISEEAYAMVAKEFGNEQSIKDKEAAKKVALKKPKEVEEEPAEKELIIKNADAAVFVPEKPVVATPKVLDKIDLDAVSGKAAKSKAEKLEEAKPKKAAPKEAVEEKVQEPVKVEKSKKAEPKKEIETIATQVPEISTPKVLDKIDLDALKKPAKKKPTKAATEEAKKAATPVKPAVGNSRKERNRIYSHPSRAAHRS